MVSCRVPKQKLETIFCRRFSCPASEYEERAFRACLHWHAKFFAPVLRRLRLETFQQDLLFIHYLGEATSLREVMANVADFQEGNSGRSGFWRKALKIRVSGRKAAKLARSLFAAERDGQIRTKTSSAPQAQSTSSHAEDRPK